LGKSTFLPIFFDFSLLCSGSTRFARELGNKMTPNQMKIEISGNFFLEFLFFCTAQEQSLPDSRAPQVRRAPTLARFPGNEYFLGMGGVWPVGGRLIWSFNCRQKQNFKKKIAGKKFGLNKNDLWSRLVCSCRSDSFVM